MLPPTAKTPSFAINAANKSYKHQYANIYFVRLRLLRPAVQENALREWKEVAGTRSASIVLQLMLRRMWRVGDPQYVPRVLDVQKGQLCYVIGTVYMDMPMKPNVLDDIARDVRSSLGTSM